MRETAFVSHRATCEHCRTKPNPCETGAQIIRRSVEEYLSGTKKETHATAE